LVFTYLKAIEEQIRIGSSYVVDSVSSLVSETFPDVLRRRKNPLFVVVDGQSVPFLDHNLLGRLSDGRARSAAIDTTI
jgi:uncharacterized protein (DUF4213/DUF364 family)